MTLSPITLDNIWEAFVLARDIFPNEVHSDGFWPEMAYRQAIAEDKPDFKYFILAQGGELIGVTGFYPNNEYSECQIESEEKVVWLGWFGIAERFRRRGFGRYLLNWTIALLKPQGFAELHLYCSASDAGANAFYSSFGFTLYASGNVDGEMVNYHKCKV